MATDRTRQDAHAAPTPGATLTAPGKDLLFLAARPGRLRFREDVGPDADPVPLHRHLYQTERFTVLAGSLLLTVAGREHRLGEGESFTIDPGILHGYAPADAHAVLIEVEIWPARHGHQFFEGVYGLAREGRLPPKTVRDVIALLALAHAHGFIMGPAPVWLMRLLAGVGAIIAALLRIEPWTERFAARPPSAPPAILYLPAGPSQPPEAIAEPAAPAPRIGPDAQRSL